MSSKVIRDPGLAIQPMRWTGFGGAPESGVHAAGHPARRGQTLEQEWLDRLDKARQEGHRQGESAGRQAVAGQIEPVLQRLAQSLEELAGFRSRYRHEAEQQIVDLALAVSRKVIHREIAVDPDALLGVVKAVLARLDSREVTAIRLHPSCADRVQAYLQQTGLPSAIRVEPDPSLEAGGVLIESQRGLVDASVETQLAEIRRGFADMMERR